MTAIYKDIYGASAKIIEKKDGSATLRISAGGKRWTKNYKTVRSARSAMSRHGDGWREVKASALKGDRNMTREQCENKILDLMIQIDKVYHEYNPYGKYLSMFILDDCVNMNNSFYADDADCPLDMHYVIESREK